MRGPSSDEWEKMSSGEKKTYYIFIITVAAILLVLAVKTFLL